MLGQAGAAPRGAAKLLSPWLWWDWKIRSTISRLLYTSPESLHQLPLCSWPLTPGNQEQNLALGVNTGVETGEAGYSHQHVQLFLSKTTARESQAWRRNATCDFLLFKTGQQSFFRETLGVLPTHPSPYSPASLITELPPSFPWFSLGLRLGDLGQAGGLGSPGPSINQHNAAAQHRASYLITYHR